MRHGFTGDSSPCFNNIPNGQLHPGDRDGQGNGRLPGKSIETLKIIHLFSFASLTVSFAVVTIKKYSNSEAMKATIKS
jgi:hypothetical protein